VPDGKTLYGETLYYDDCGSAGCTPQYGGNISRMAHSLAHGNTNYSENRDVVYAYDLMNRLTSVNDANMDSFDEAFAYDAQGRIMSQRRGANVTATSGGEYSYYAQSNRLGKVSAGMSTAVDSARTMSTDSNFVYDADGNMIYDASKKMTVSYDYRGLPTEFRREVASASGVAGAVDSVRLLMTYDGSGSRIMKRRDRKTAGETAWTTELTTHYTGIGSEIRESGLDGTAKVVVNLPQGLGRYAVASAAAPGFEWYLRNHLGSTMLVYGTGASNSVRAAYDYRAFGEQVDLTVPADKVTETFTGKELDDETELSYFGARYLDQMLGSWVSADPYREFFNSYAYGPANPINGYDADGEIWRTINIYETNKAMNVLYNVVAIQADGQSVMGRRTIGPDLSNTKNIRVRHVVQEWQYDPEASEKTNAMYPLGSKRTVDQVKVDQDLAIRKFKELYKVDAVLYDNTQKTAWNPWVFNSTYQDFPGVETIAPDPDGNVTVGDLQCDSCSE